MAREIFKGLKSVVKEGVRRMGYDLKQRPTSKDPKLTYPQLSRFLYFRRMFDLIRNVEGDIVECGVYRGFSLLLLAALVKEEQKGRTLWGFDAFGELPPLSEHDFVKEPSPKKWFEREVRQTSLPQVRFFLQRSGLDEGFLDAQVTLVKGLFQETLSKFRGPSIALLHLDINLYDSYQVALRELYPKVSKGGVLLFDEYIDTEDLVYWPGAQKAIDDYLGEEKRNVSRDTVTGKYYLVKRHR